MERWCGLPMSLLSRISINRINVLPRIHFYSSMSQGKCTQNDLSVRMEREFSTFERNIKYYLKLWSSMSGAGISCDTQPINASFNKCVSFTFYIQICSPHVMEDLTIYRYLWPLYRHAITLFIYIFIYINKLPKTWRNIKLSSDNWNHQLLHLKFDH